jgi:hypothetical protein
VDDIEEVIKRADHYRFEDSPNLGVLNAFSSLPSSKANLKRSIKERIRMLAGAYISLATFIPDEDAEYVSVLHGEPNQERVREIFSKVISEMDKLRKDMEGFALTETAETSPTAERS